MSLPKLNRPPIGTPVLQVATYGPPAEIAALRHTRQWETWSDETYKAVTGLLAAASLTHVETLTADSVITQGAPTADGELLVVLLTQDGTGGWTITWDTAVFDGSAKVDIDARMNISTLFLFVGNGGFWVQVSPAFSLGTGLVSPLTVIGNGRDELVLATTGQIITNGTGSPEAAITAVQGSLYLQDDGTVWRKATGTGNTGWVLLPSELLADAVDTSTYSLTTSFADIPSCTVTLSAGFWQIIADVEILADSVDGSAVVQLVLNGSANANQMIASTNTGIVVIPASKHWHSTVGGTWVAKLQGKKNSGAGTSAVIAGIRAVRLHS